MALDEDGEKARAKLLANAKMSVLLRDLRLIPRAEASPQYQTLWEWLDNNTAAERDDYLEIIVSAAETVEAAPRTAAPPAAPASPLGKAFKPAGKPPEQGKRPTGIDAKLASAPYRFITIPDEVVLAPPEVLAPIDEPLANGYCATIGVEWIAETPLLIGGPALPKGQQTVVAPLKIGEHYVIPGATQRGLIRSAVEILSYSKLTQANFHYRFGIRDFYHPHYRNENSVSNAAAVKAGFLHVRPKSPSDPADVVTERETVFEITPAQSWHRVTIDSLGVLGDPPFDTTLAGKKWASWTLKEKYSAVKMWPDGAKAPVFSQTDLKRFRQVDEHPKGQFIFKADASGETRAMFVAANAVPGGGNKKFDYIVVPDPEADKIALPRDVVHLFERMYSEPSKGVERTLTGSWAVLEPAARAGGIPVFYVGDPVDPGDETFFFGLTRLFKIPHKFSVGQMLAGTQGAHVRKPKLKKEGPKDAHFDGYANPDFTEALFGYVVEPEELMGEAPDMSFDPGAVARKGRIAFGFARLADPNAAVESPSMEAIQMAPRASYAPFYLRGDREKDWSHEKSKLAGRKSYFPRFPTPPAAQKALDAFDKFRVGQEKAIADQGGTVSPNVKSRLAYLTPRAAEPLVFKGRIEMRNVTAEQIGAVLYALTHGGDRNKRFRHMVGRGKPFGAGQMRIGRLSFAAEANDPGADGLGKAPAPDELFDPATGTGWLTAADRSLAPFLEAFEDFMRGALAGGKLQAYPMVEPVREWFGMADPAEGAKGAAPGPKAPAGRLGYKPYPGLNLFKGYGELRKATQWMHSAQKPLPDERLMGAPDGTPPRAPKPDDAPPEA